MNILMFLVTFLVQFGLLVVAIWATCIARSGLSNWKRQADATADRDLGRHLFRAITDFHEAIKSQRFVIHLPSETPEALPDLREDQKRGYNNVHVYRGRLKTLRTALANLNRLWIEIELFWGDDFAADEIGEVKNVFAELNEAVSWYCSVLEENEYVHDREALADDKREVRLDIESHTPREERKSDNAFTKKIDAAFDSLKDAIKVKLR